MKKFFQITLISCFVITSEGFAEDICCDSLQEGFFLGLGASYNTVRIKQHYSASGIGEVFDENDTLIASGEAGGPAAPSTETLNTLAPVIQAGYLNRMNGSNCFWGLKASYQYLGVTSINRLTDTPQSGFLDPENSSPLAFTGNVITKSAQSEITHMINFLAFMGMSLCDFDFYVGVGPSVFKTKTNIYQAFGFANLSGLPRDATGTPVSFSASKWVWAGSLQLGLSYSLPSCWFVDFNYTATLSGNYRHNFSAPFRADLVGEYSDIGILYVNTKTRIWTQNLCLTINKYF
ncbi:MAG: hypothetical protein KDK62_08385 [Chlamydiia bacterium]|nr:hypothetical protein [Chlamydiia bacterium]